MGLHTTMSYCGSEMHQLLVRMILIRCCLGTCSSWLPVTSGVPQGSILGPLLFLLYVNDIPNLPFSKDSHLMMYANDLLLFKPISCQQDLWTFQCDVNLISQWTLQNHLSLNCNKTKYMLISRGRPGSFSCSPIYVYNNQIESVHQYKHLGVWICDDLGASMLKVSATDRGGYWATSWEHFPHTAPWTPFSTYTSLRCYPLWTMPV